MIIQVLLFNFILIKKLKYTHTSLNFYIVLYYNKIIINTCSKYKYI